jgi:hypothetical protein
MRSHFSKWVKTAKCEDKQHGLISKGLAVFPAGSTLRVKEDFQRIFQALCRGRALVYSAKTWRNPEAGKTGKSGAIRGLQWRLVMAWGGFELIAKTLSAKSGGSGLGPDDFRVIVEKLPDVDLPLIQKPDLKRAILKKWTENEGSEKLLLFLGVRSGDKTSLENWLTAQEQEIGLQEYLCLAKALRNCTAHGALSAQKCIQLQLESPLLYLPRLLYAVTEEIFGLLTSGT